MVVEEVDFSSIRDRVLIYGEPGVGKTWNVLALLRDHPESELWVIDPDAGMKRVIQEFSDDVRKRTHYFLARSWKDVRKIFRHIRKRIKSKDFLLLEHLGQLWDMAQSYYIKQVFTKATGDFYIELRRRLIQSKKDEQARLDGWKDWSIIKKLHNTDFMDVVTRGINCNIVATSSAGELYEFEKDKDLRNLYSSVGLKPEGEKHNAYRFDVVLCLGRTGNKFFFTPVKLRGRPLFGRTDIPKGASVFQVLWLKARLGFPPKSKISEIKKKKSDRRRFLD